MVLICVAIINPTETKQNEVRPMKTNAARKLLSNGINPIAVDMASIMVPFIKATVAPPNVLPRTILTRETGATRIS